MFSGIQLIPMTRTKKYRIGETPIMEDFDEGMLRFNESLNAMEIYTNENWVQFTSAKEEKDAE